MTRLFVAVDLPEDLRDRLAWLQSGIPGARWVADDQLHLTLRFIGEVDGHVFDAIADALERIHRPPFDLELRGVGHFPPRGQPRVLWVGTTPNPELMALRDAVERRVVEVGIKPEGRKFHPHVTLARLNGSPTHRVQAYLAEHALLRFDPFEVGELHLYSSSLHPSGAVHTQEYSYTLAAEP